jgi:hypothetical protein
MDGLMSMSIDEPECRDTAERNSASGWAVRKN